MNTILQPVEPPEVRRARQLFSFLKAFAEKGKPPEKSIDNQLWKLTVRSLPDHPTIEVGEVRLGEREQSGGEPIDGANALLTVRRPTLTAAPRPLEVLRDYVKPGWDRANGSIEVLPVIPRTRGNDTVMERFDADTARVAALEEWRTRWTAWADAERPAVAAMEVFSRLYELHGRIERESEHVELILGDGHLRWRQVNGIVNHPVLLQRVELLFDPAVPEFTVIDADRGPELYSAAFYDEQHITAAQISQLRDQLEQGGYHPLAGEATSGYLRSLAQRLGAGSVFREEMEAGQTTDVAVVMRDPVLFLRTRPSGFAAAFDRVLEDLAHRTELPVALTRLVGVEPPAPPDPIRQTGSPWGEPSDVLLSKPANAEQIQIARALERHKAVLVQGPPGTGKSHTIANLIGHLVAHGKRVLVTSHTTKALRVLRDQVVSSLRPLCVAVLDTDLESRKQMEEAVRGILSRLTGSSEEQLAAEVSSLAERRAELNSRIARTTRDLQLARGAEYQPIIIGGEPIDPVDAARWVRANQEGNDWIPGKIEPGAPVPLAEEDLAELYGTNASVGATEDEEIALGLPAREPIPEPNAFRELVDQLEEGTEEYSAFWQSVPEESVLPSLEALADVVDRAVRDLQALEPWQRAIVAAGHAGATEAELWRELATQVKGGVDAWERTRRLLLDHEVRIDDAHAPEQRREIVSEIIDHMSSGRRLGTLSLLLHPRWRAAIEATTVNGTPPVTVLEFKAVSAHLALEDGRSRLAARWRRQGQPAGLPVFESMPSPPEPALATFVEQFDELLEWWPSRWSDVQAAMRPVGFRWREFRQAEVARATPAAPFERDASILSGPLRRAVVARVAQARRERARRLLRELDNILAAYSGPVCKAVREAVQLGDRAAYADAWTTFVRLIGKQEIAARRRQLLNVVRAVAPDWAEGVSRRRGVHSEARVPGYAPVAWRWRQLQQEIDRRAALDEIGLTRRLEHDRAQLRDVTAELIDRRAWLGQKRRTNLNAQSALQGWSDVQRRIGRGTGRRVPTLQAHARELLAKASGAVPVWIMPLARVAESFDPRTRFDVVIVDEASQSDVTGLLAWYLGDRIAVVGDHEQVSPLAVGQRLDEMDALINQHLQGIPNNVLYDGRTSIYDLARQCFGGLISLWEHFRCVPDIIEFSNELSYDFHIRPLRNGSVIRKPHVVEYVVPPELYPERSGGANQAEARVIVALLKAAIESSEYDGKTIGAITLLGDEQAGLIQDLAVSVIDAVELERRRFVAGNAAQFQGDERHVVFLSMVDTPADGRLRLSQTVPMKQRYNVAASRAKDQLWLVHSLDPGRDLQEEDLRYRLIEYMRSPGARRRAAELAKRRAESPFEREVISRLIAAGYQVEPQVWVGGYRIDMVVADRSGQVAVECDGDRFHGIDQIPHDMARQAVLERAGWRFVRVRGTRFYRDPDGTTAWLLDELGRLGVRPTSLRSETSSTGDDEVASRERVVRRAWEIMKELGWLPEQSEELADEEDGLGERPVVVT